MTERTRYVSVGKLGKARGVLGEIYVTPATDFPKRFLNLKEIYVKNRDRWEKMAVVSARLIAGRPVLRFENIENPEAASRLTNRELAVKDEQLVRLPDDTYYLFDLVGCAVLDATTGGKLGEVTDVQQGPANDVYVVRLTTGKQLLVPAVRRFVRQVDIKKRLIVVDSSGLLDIV